MVGLLAPVQVFMYMAKRESWPVSVRGQACFSESQHSHIENSGKNFHRHQCTTIFLIASWTLSL